MDDGSSIRFFESFQTGKYGTQDPKNEYGFPQRRPTGTYWAPEEKMVDQVSALRRQISETELYLQTNGLPCTPAHVFRQVSLDGSTNIELQVTGLPRHPIKTGWLFKLPSNGDINQNAQRTIQQRIACSDHFGGSSGKNVTESHLHIILSQDKPSVVGVTSRTLPTSARAQKAFAHHAKDYK